MFHSMGQRFSSLSGVRERIKVYSHFAGIKQWLQLAEECGNSGPETELLNGIGSIQFIPFLFPAISYYMLIMYTCIQG